MHPLTTLTLFAQRQPDAAAQAGAMAGALAPLACCGVFMLVLIVVGVVSGWKIFEKAGRPGWEALIPFYNTYVMVVEINKMEILWFILTFVPFANWVAGIMICLELAKKFGKSAGFGIGLILLPIVFLPMLAFGDAQYEGRSRYKRKKPRYEDDEYDDEDEEDDRPRKRGRREDDYDDEDDDRPRSRRRRDDD